MNESCQHHRVDNETWQCAACGEQMTSMTNEVETVLSAPNAAACTNPECSGDVDDPNCWNSGSVYVPDRSRAREVPIAVHVTYECERCDNSGTVFTSREIIWDCGLVHRGDSVPILRESAAP